MRIIEAEIKKLPAIIWSIDNYDVLKEINSEYEGVVNQISRDGQGLGIYMLIAASRPGAVRFNVINNFKNKIALYMIDRMDHNTVVGRTDYPVDEIRGRALVKQDEVHQMQFYVADGATGAVEYVEQLQHIIRVIDENSEGERPEGIPMLPEQLDRYNFKNYLSKPYPAEWIPIGLDVEHVRPQFIDLTKGRCIIVGGGKSGKTNLLKLVLENRKPELCVHVVDTKEGGLYAYSKTENVTYYNSMEGAKEFLLYLRSIAMERKERYEAAAADNPSLSPKQFYADYPTMLVLIEEWDNFAGWIKEMEFTGAERMFEDLSLMNVSFLVTTAAAKMKGYDAPTKWMKETTYGIILGNAGEQNLFSTDIKRSDQTELGMGYLTENGRTVKLVTAKVETEEE